MDILFFQFAQPTQVRGFRAAIFGLPFVEAAFAKAIRPAQIGPRYAGLGFLKDRDDLVLAKS